MHEPLDATLAIPLLHPLHLETSSLHHVLSEALEHVPRLLTCQHNHNLVFDVQLGLENAQTGLECLHETHFSEVTLCLGAATLRELVDQQLVLVEVSELEEGACAIAGARDDLGEELLDLWDVEVGQAIEGGQAETLGIGERAQEGRFT